MTKKQTKTAARLLAVMLLWEATDNMEEFFKDMFDERAEGRLSDEEKIELEDALTEIAQDLLGKDIRFNTVREVINYVKKK